MASCPLYNILYKTPILSYPLILQCLASTKTGTDSGVVEKAFSILNTELRAFDGPAEIVQFPERLSHCAAIGYDSPHQNRPGEG